MGEEFKDFTTTPTLTFGETPDTQELPSTVAEETELVADSAFNENNLTAEEKKMVEDFSQKIDLHNSQAILQYGAGTQKKMADFSENALKNVRTKDMGEVGDMLSGLVVELKSFEITEEDKGILGLFKKIAEEKNASSEDFVPLKDTVKPVSPVTSVSSEDVSVAIDLTKMFIFHNLEDIT